MIEFLDSNICCLKLTTTTTELLYDFSNTLSQGEAHDAIVILDKVNLKEIFGTLKTLLATQKKIGKQLVIVAEHAVIPEFPGSWALVPTKTEAVDFILFEQMQRDLGF